MLKGDDLRLFFKMADSTKLENKKRYNPMLYQFCIANNEPIKVHQLLFSTVSHIKQSFQQIFNIFKPFA